MKHAPLEAPFLRGAGLLALACLLTGCAYGYGPGGHVLPPGHPAIGPAHAALPRASSASNSNIATAAPTVHDTDCAEYDTEVMPDVLHREAPVHPDAARAAGIEGTVMLYARVLEDSTVGEVRVMRSIPALDSAAVACVRRWRFKPGEHCRHAYPMWIGIPIKFALP